jgi:hypothetical protein
MDDIIVIKATNNMNYSSNFPDVTKELVSETFALGCSFNKTCDIAKLNGCVDGLL